MPTDPYILLGIDRTATLEEVRATYRQAVLKCHPDVSRGDAREAERIFRELTEAYKAILLRLLRQRQPSSKALTPAELATVEVVHSLTEVRSAFHKARRAKHPRDSAADSTEALRVLRELSEAYRTLLHRLFARGSTMRHGAQGPLFPRRVQPDDARRHAASEEDA